MLLCRILNTDGVCVTLVDFDYGHSREVLTLLAKCVDTAGLQGVQKQQRTIYLLNANQCCITITIISLKDTKLLAGDKS